MPQAAIGVEIHRSIKQPTRPGRILRRVGHAVKEHVIDAREQQVIRDRLYIGEGNLEVLPEPGE